MRNARFSVGLSGDKVREIDVSPPDPRTPKQKQLEKLKIELVILIGLLLIAMMLFIYFDRRARELELQQLQPEGPVGTFNPSLREEFPEPQNFR